MSSEEVKMRAQQQVKPETQENEQIGVNPQRKFGRFAQIVEGIPPENESRQLFQTIFEEMEKQNEAIHGLGAKVDVLSSMAKSRTRRSNHEIVKDFQCPACMKAYASGSSLKTHLYNSHQILRKFIVCVGGHKGKSAKVNFFFEKKEVDYDFIRRESMLELSMGGKMLEEHQQPIRERRPSDEIFEEEEDEDIPRNPGVQLINSERLQGPGGLGCSPSPNQ